MTSLNVFTKRPFRALSLPVLAGLVAVSLVACGGDDDDDTTPAPTGTTAAATTAAASPATAAYPVKVTDLLGRQVEIKAKPKTIVALSPTAVEYVYAVGGTVAGRADSATFPEEAKAAKEVGTAYQPSFETILSLKPDLVVADSVIHAQPQLRKPIEDLGVPVIFAGADSYQRVLDGLTLMGKVLDSNERAKTAVAAVTKARDDAKAVVTGKNLSAVALIAGRDNTLYAANKTSFAGDILAQAGITNLAGELGDSGPFPGYSTLAPEKLVQFDPVIVFTITPGPASVPRLSTLIPNIPPFKGLKAVTGNKVVELQVDPFLQAPGPRIVDAFKAIAAAGK